MNVHKKSVALLCAVIAALAGCQSETDSQLASASAALEGDPCPEGMNRIEGTAGDDVLVGTNEADCILGLEGNDQIEGRNGDDVLVGGPGNDTISGGNGQDTIIGGEGDDSIDAGNGDDVVSGGPGNDTLIGHNGVDLVEGDGGNDVIHAGSGDDQVLGGDGNDVAVGGKGNDVVDGGEGSDACDGAGCESAEPGMGDCDCGEGQQCIEATGLCVYCIDDVECDSGDACQVPLCEPLTGCTAVDALDGTPCPDGDVCNGDESCVAGSCSAGTALDCDDGDECTADSCDPDGGCGHTPIDENGNGVPDCEEGQPLPEVCAPEALACGSFTRECRDAEGECVLRCNNNLSCTRTILCITDDECNARNEPDRCPDDPDKTAPGDCGCGVPDVDEDGDGRSDCLLPEVCPQSELDCGAYSIECRENRDPEGACIVQCSHASNCQSAIVCVQNEGCDGRNPPKDTTPTPKGG